MAFELRAGRQGTGARWGAARGLTAGAATAARTPWGIRSARVTVFLEVTALPPMTDLAVSAGQAATADIVGPKCRSEGRKGEGVVEE